jgi:YggT family protein
LIARIPLALTRDDVADYVSALFLVYIVLIFLNILISWIPRMPTYSRGLRAAMDFVTETTNPYLNLFRRVIPPLGRGFALDLSPIIGVIVLYVAQALIVGLIEG